MGGELPAVADAEDRKAEVKDFRGDGGSVFLIDALGAAGENQAGRPKFFDLRKRGFRVENAGGKAEVFESAADEVTGLGTEVEDDNRFWAFGHGFRLDVFGDGNDAPVLDSGKPDNGKGRNFFLFEKAVADLWGIKVGEVFGDQEGKDGGDFQRV